MCCSCMLKLIFVRNGPLRLTSDLLDRPILTYITTRIHARGSDLGAYVWECLKCSCRLVALHWSVVPLRSKEVTSRPNIVKRGGGIRVDGSPSRAMYSERVKSQSVPQGLGRKQYRRWSSNNWTMHSSLSFIGNRMLLPYANQAISWSLLCGWLHSLPPAADDWNKDCRAHFLFVPTELQNTFELQTFQTDYYLSYDDDFKSILIMPSDYFSLFWDLDVADKFHPIM